jgi:hypothetical protein
MVEKPPQGDPCNACGLCCRMELCAIGRIVYGDIPGPCPAIAITPKGSECGMVLHPGQFAPEAVRRHGTAKVRASAKELLAIGLGCDAWLDGEPENPAFDAKISRNVERRASQIRDALRVWHNV